MESAQSPMSFAKQSVPHFSYAAATMATSVELTGQGVAQLADEFGAIVQAAVPGDDGARRGNIWLLFAMRFLRGVEGAIEDPYATLRIRFVAVGAVGSESRADFSM